jgi:PKD repeat protein
MRKYLLVAALVLAMGAVVLADGDQAVPLGIIVEPPSEEGLSVHIWVDKPAYAFNEHVTVHFEVNQDAYVYIWDISPDGVCLIFPNQNEMNNHVSAGTHTVPGPGATYHLTVQPPAGTEYLQIVATKQPVGGIIQFFGGFSPGSQFACSPQGRQTVAQLNQVKSLIDSAVPENQRAFDFTSFQVVSGTPPAYGTLRVNTTPAFARLYIDGTFYGWTPREVNLVQGYHSVLLKKVGYQDYTAHIYIQAGHTRTINVILARIAANQPPVARFTYSPASPQPGQWVQFDASSSYDPDGHISSYQWDFDGNGTVDATGQVVYRQFATPGAYQVTLTVTDDKGATNTATQTVTVVLANQPPVARFTVSPAAPVVGSPVTFDASSSYDPDGSIVSYQWDLDGNGTVDQSGVTVTVTYYTAASYTVTLYVTDNAGATGQVSKVVQVGTGGPAGMPPMDGTPGIYVWGTDTWHITVNGSSSWTSAHSFRIELRTDGQFVNVGVEAGPSPLGLTPEPSNQGWKVVFTGAVAANRITYTFQVRNASSIYFKLQLDMDGDGTLDSAPGFVHLRQLMVNPPTNPFVVGRPSGYSGPFVPSINFKIGMAWAYNEHSKFVFYSTTIEALESGS